MKSNGPAAITLTTVIDRKSPDLPRFVIIPSALVEGLKLEGTTSVEVTINGASVDRRTIRRWDEERWFVSITERDCRRLRVETGMEIEITIRPVGEDLPEAIADLIRTNRRAAKAWNGLSESQRRMLRDHVAAAKQPSTSRRRARKSLLGCSSV